MPMLEDTPEQRQLLRTHLHRAFAPAPPESGAGEGWPCVIQLVMFWLKNPDKVPRPEAPPSAPTKLRGLVFIEDDGTIRAPTTRDI